MNAHCITCRHLRMVAMSRGTGWVPMFCCPITGQQFTHLVDEVAPKECREEK